MHKKCYISASGQQLTMRHDFVNWSCVTASMKEHGLMSWYRDCRHGRPHIGANEVSWPPGEIDEKLNSENMQKKSSFLCLCYILTAIKAGRCRERRYADHIFIQIYFRMHHFVVKFSKFLHLRRQGGIDPLIKILRTPLISLLLTLRFDLWPTDL